ncbi:uncharacterized protein LOC127738276 [Mytilus californianus]|uniref:uncharacterized protein LOC127738276 n=1 Tax=Mytilus californianus TaxID=6549 RepID=UPI0022473EA3|nr:uncharacterized protein LOC127738276 [Mytilus californianus]
MSLRRRTESTTDILDDNDANIWTNRQKKLRGFLQKSCVVNVVLLVVLVILLITKIGLYEKDKKTLQSNEVSFRTTNSNNGVCLPCDSLGSSIKVDDTLFDSISRTENGGKICCYKDQEYMQKMISRMMDPMITEPAWDIDYVIERKMKWWRNRPNSIHMYIDLNNLTGTNLAWTYSKDHLGTAYFKDLTYNATNQSIEIVETSIYFVYSAITFDFGDVTTVGLYRHKIKQWHRLLPKTERQPLLRSRFGGSSETRRMYTSFLCGAFKLDSGLIVQNEISPTAIKHVKKSKYASYFGLFKI